jgi:hypothetical protein
MLVATVQVQPAVLQVAVAVQVQQVGITAQAMVVLVVRVTTFQRLSVAQHYSRVAAVVVVLATHLPVVAQVEQVEVLSAVQVVHHLAPSAERQRQRIQHQVVAVVRMMAVRLVAVVALVVQVSSTFAGRSKLKDCYGTLRSTQ